MPDGFAETLRAAQAGDEQAVACLWREMQPRLLRYLCGRERHAAEDVASETWVRVARDLRRFEGDEDEFRAWLFTLARHSLIDWQRRARRRPAITGDLGGLADRPSHNDTAAEALEALDTDRALRLVARLPRDQADVVLLRVVAGLDAARVGAILGKRPATVRVIQHRALRSLAALVGVQAPSVERGVTS